MRYQYINKSHCIENILTNLYLVICDTENLSYGTRQQELLFLFRIYLGILHTSHEFIELAFLC